MAKLARPPPLWLFLLLSNVTTLALPLTGLWALRLYESALVRQTEAELVAQAAVLAAAFSEDMRRAAPGGAPEAPQPTGPVDPSGAPRQDLDLARDPVLPPLPPGAPAPTVASPGSLAAGRALAPVLRGAQSITLAALRLTDRNGVVVASTGGDLGKSLAAWPEVATVLHGAAIAATMHRREVDGPLQSDEPRTNGLRVFVVLPVRAHGGAGIDGTVVVSRSAKTLRDAARGKLGELALLAATLLAAGTLLALALASVITRPLAGIVRQAQRIAAGGEAEPGTGSGALNGSREVADLADAITRMATTLDQRARYISAFAASVSHAFKTPLAALRGAAELLEDDAELGLQPERQRLLHVITDSTIRLTLLVTRMLDLARADMTRPLQGPAVPVAPILARVADRYRAQGLNVQLSGPPIDARLPADGIEAVLVSLLDNVQTHAGPAATVHVATASSRSGSSIDIADDGPGISTANRGRIFDPFFTTARPAGGTGLGLPIARAIVAGAGGSLELAPSPSGARFLLKLPL